MNKELKEILNNEVSELDLVKAHLSFSYNKYDSFVINWCLTDNTINELNSIGVKTEVVSDYYNGDYSIVRW